MNYTIIDNFLDSDFYQEISEIIKSEKIPWYFRKKDTPNSKNLNGYFCCGFYDNDRPDHPLYDNIIVPILEKLECVSPIMVRANLILRDKDSLESSFHVDYQLPHSKTAIFFLTTCNAKTVLKINNQEIFVESKENRMLIFDTLVEHKLIFQKDVHKRYILNFNYFGRKTCQ